METPATQNHKNGVGGLAGHIVIRQRLCQPLITEEPDELKLTSGSVGGAVREGGSYPEGDVLQYAPFARVASLLLSRKRHIL